MNEPIQYETDSGQRVKLEYYKSIRALTGEINVPQAPFRLVMYIGGGIAKNTLGYFPSESLAEEFALHLQHVRFQPNFTYERKNGTD